MIGMKPKDAIKLKEVPLVTRESYPPEEVLPEDGLYQYLLQPEKNTMTSDAEQLIGYGQRLVYRKREITENLVIA